MLPSRNKRARRMLFEALEPRVLLSGDPLHTAIDDANLRIERGDTTTSAPESAHGDRLTLDGVVLGTAAATERWEATDTVIFVDSGVAGYESVVQGLAGLDDETGMSEARVVILDATQDGIEQITATLSEHDDLAAVHLLSHGDSGQLQLGDTLLDMQALGAYLDDLAIWGDALAADGDVLLYGCNVADGAWGADFVGKLAALTGADVAASIDLTGATAFGGDWSLEHASGAIEASTLSVDYAGVFVVIEGDEGGGARKDRLVSETTNDTLKGKKLDDTYVFKGSFGQDKVEELATGGSLDTLDTTGVTATNIKLRADGWYFSPLMYVLLASAVVAGVVGAVMWRKRVSLGLLK